ncbi:sigma 54-interacting transcriptional regulator [Salinibacter altiplanensis]|uniref:sigma 54-interacting transcriptional regulator n=1 Tax=Salinibacter altiplanensis TaxID=1803181 RepID=UPI000C9FECC3|nr:sigma 54-interacting transcriptional regulator [Salinibacter altiplanensis]
MPPPARILIVEDEFAVAMELEDHLEALGYTVVDHVMTGAAAIERAAATELNLVLMDVHLDGPMDGVEAAQTIRDNHPLPVVFVTAYSDDETLQRATDTTPFGYVVKPFNEREIYAAVEVALQTHALQRRVERAHDDLRQLLNGLRQGTALIDAIGHLRFLSDPAARLLGVSSEAAIGTSWADLLPVDDDTLEALRGRMDNTSKDKDPVSATFSPNDGTSYHVEIEVRPDPRDDSRHILVFYDVTEVHELRRMLDDQSQFHDLVGTSAPMQDAYEQIQSVAEVNTTVLVQGETGTGKELAARAIHDESPRADAPFVTVNCAALNPDLAGSRLFGHRKGAFTGATENREGYFEAADGGTLFLDEIGDVPLDVQRQLLRVLEEEAVTRLGETEARPVDVRIVAATHRTLDDEVEADRFRQDLLYRIRIARVPLPPLRERRSDLPLLVRTFLREIRARTGAEVDRVGDEALRRLLNYDWPGNVRELQNALEAALIRASGDVLRAGDLPPEIRDASPSAPSAPEEAERIRAALEQTAGNRTEAAELLGISRATLYRRLDEYDIG